MVPQLEGLNRQPAPTNQRLPLRPMHVAHVITTLSHGGAETQLLGLCRVQTSRGIACRVISLLPLGSLAPKFAEHGIPTMSLDMSRRGVNLRAISILRDAIQTVDVVHSHMLPANLLARFATIGMRNKPILINTVHATKERGVLRNLLFALTDHLADHTTNVSQHGLERYRRLRLTSTKRSSWMPNGVDYAEFYFSEEDRTALRSELGIERERFVWLAVGRLSPVKDYPNLLVAFTKLLGHSRNPLLLIAGDGPERNKLAHMISTLGLEHSVRLLGLRQDIPRLLRTADALVLSSRMEGLPMVILEATATELPIVATRVGGIPEFAKISQNAKLVPPEDPDALHQAMATMMDLPKDRLRALGRMGRQLSAEVFSLPRLADQWISLYESLLANRSPTGQASRSLP